MTEKKKEKKPGFWALAGKLGLKMIPYLAKLLKATKFLKFGLAVASFATYAYMFTWKFALLLMLALAWHESGHVWAMKRMGIKTKGFYFIPFLGGAAIAEEQAKTYASWSFVAIMGPVWGLLLAIGSCALYYTTGSPLFAAAAGWMAFLNLFNLFPVVPLDGGQIIRSIAFSINKTFGFVFLIVSLIIGTVLMFSMHIGLFGFLLGIGILDVIFEFVRRKGIAKSVGEYLERAEGYRNKACDAALSDDRSDMTKYWNETAEYYEGRAKEKQLSIPTSMNRKQLIASIVAYAGVVIALIVIVKLMAHIPGGDLASEFLADK